MIQSRGFSFVEIIVVIGILMVGLVSLGQISSNMLKGLRNDELAQRASYIAQEGIEAVRLARDKSWATNILNKTQGTDYFLSFTGGEWNIVTIDPGLIEGIFKRVIRFDDAYRDGIDDIVSSGGTLDASTKRVKVAVSWGQPPQNVELITYLTNFAGETEAMSVEFTGGTTDFDLANFPANSGWGDPAQGFTLSENITAAKAEVFIKRAAVDPSDIFLEVRSLTPRGAVVATSNTIDSAALSSSLSWTTFTFQNTVNLSSGTAYYLRLRSIPDSAVPFSGAAGTIHWGYQFPGTYSGGTAYRYVTNLSDQILSSYDFSFRVYKKL